MDNNLIVYKSFQFAVRTVNLYKILSSERKEFTLSKQLLRSGTSIGANVAEAQHAQSRPDFLAKLSIALKETAESKYWIQLLLATHYLSDIEAASILRDCIELEKILVSIVKKLKLHS